MHYVAGNLPKKLPNDNLPFIDDWVEHAGDNGTLTEDIIDIAPVGKHKRTAADAPLLAWIPERQSFLDEMMHLNGYESEGITCLCGGVLPEFCMCIIRCIELRCGTGHFFQRIMLKKLGVQIQLGHNPGERCYNPRPSAGDNFVVIGLNGVHEVALDFCGCASAQNESKVSAYEFYHLLARCTDNSGLIGIKDQYSAFMRMVHQWCNLKQLGCGGRGHDPAGVNATAKGELGAGATVYQMEIHIRKAVSSDTADPSLNAGWAYFMQDHRYKSYIADRATKKQEQSTCVSHNAVNMADIKSSRGLAATGVGTIDCARHNMKLPNGVGDLQKGEQYINMDYIVCSALFIFTMSMMPEWLCPPPHVDKCCTNFSFNWSRYVGQTDGEAPEWGWSNINQVASSTKEMGPGTHWDTLDDHFGDWNWKKITVLGQTLHKKIVEAIKWAKEHSETLAELETTIHLTLITQWKAEIESWEEDNSSPNPFESWFNSVTQAAVQLQLIELETQELQAGINVSLHTDISPSRLITSGMDLEDQQAHLRSSLADISLHDTDKQKAMIQTQITSLQQRLDAWAHIQELYMPIVCQLRHQLSKASRKSQELKLEDFNLWLPLHLPANTPVDQKLAGHEWELRYA
ncbi:uncharacterized protein EDB91DRAFT_1256137 [Suillus paluster]|uniref:uncharacterized protein n=1 Tax=Suillus paluster TaxID=48578 RepID=UPI001B8831D5|nr:uncharacterized protein EDB91DRAFT_1256137 [Suillus paluster]KAG1722323.1 hypothetical protein EDB91DRAFT_1256137 [Suillus paluster]